MTEQGTKWNLAKDTRVVSHDGEEVEPDVAERLCVPSLVICILGCSVPLMSLPWKYQHQGGNSEAWHVDTLLSTLRPGTGSSRRAP